MTPGEAIETVRRHDPIPTGSLGSPQSRYPRNGGRSSAPPTPRDQTRQVSRPDRPRGSFQPAFPHQQPCWVNLGRSVPGRTDGQTDRWTDAHPSRGQTRSRPTREAGGYLSPSGKRGRRREGGKKKCGEAKGVQLQHQKQTTLAPCNPWGGKVLGGEESQIPGTNLACTLCALSHLPQLPGWAGGGGSRGAPLLFTGRL